MKRLLMLILLLLGFTAGYSQSDFRPGYVVANAGDTLTGLVDYREGVRAFSVCQFKRLKDQEAVVYEPGQIIGYGFKGDRQFISKEIPDEKSASQVVFLEVLVKGPVTLYKYENSFLVEKEGALHKLHSEVKEEEVNGVMVKRKTKEHMSVFNMLMFDCVELRPTLQKKVITLSERPVTTLVEQYNRCSGATTVSFKEHKPWMKVGVGLAAGLELGKIEFESDYDAIKHLRGDFDLSKLAMFGVSFEFKAPRLTERISFLVDLYYVNASYHLHKVSTLAPYTYTDNVTIEIDALKIPLGARYTFPGKTLTPFGGFGLTNVVHLSSGSQWTHESVAEGFFEGQRSEALEINKSQLGFWAGAGTGVYISPRIDAFVELRYEKTDGIAGKSLSSMSTTRSSIENIDVIVGVRLK